MKKPISAMLAVMLSALCCACGSDISSNTNNTFLNDATSNAAAAAETDSEISAIVTFDGSILESDGIIEPMDTKELIEKLSALKMDMTPDEVTALFGKEPYLVQEANSMIFKYFSGDVTITLWGTQLFQATVECGGSEVAIALACDAEE